MVWNKLDKVCWCVGFGDVRWEGGTDSGISFLTRTSEGTDDHAIHSSGLADNVKNSTLATRQEFREEVWAREISLECIRIQSRREGNRGKEARNRGQQHSKKLGSTEHPRKRNTWTIARPRALGTAHWFLTRPLAMGSGRRLSGETGKKFRGRGDSEWVY